MNKILLLDDEELCFGQVKEAIQGQDIELFWAKSITKAKHILTTEDIQLLIIDINLDHVENGLEFAQYNLETTQLPILFFTGHSDGILTSMIQKYSPVAHVIKPANIRQLTIDINRGLKSKNNSPQFTNKLTNKIFLKTKEYKLSLDTRDIIYIEADGSYVKIYTIDQHYLVSKNLKVVLEKIATSTFMRISRSHAINTTFIKRLFSNSVELTNGHRIPFTKKYYEELKNIYTTI